MNGWEWAGLGLWLTAAAFWLWMLGRTGPREDDD